MRILITNDDGIHAPGLAVLHEIASTLSEDVWTIAPAMERSGVGHCISYSSPARTEDWGDRRIAVDGMPADCVLIGLSDILADSPPDLILSGVNRGNNAGENTLYSGTIGAAIEGALHGVRSIALSQFYGPRNRDTDDTFEASRQWGERVVRSLLDAPWGHPPYGVFYNVNFPPCPGAEVKGMRASTQGFRQGSEFRATPVSAPRGTPYYFIHGGAQDAACDEGTDVGDNLADYISVTPMTADLTAHAQLQALREALA